jgi:hypothetical protein
MVRRSSTSGSKGAMNLGDPGGEVGDHLLRELEPGEDRAHEERVVGAELPGQGLLQGRDLLPQLPPGQVGQDLGVAGPLHQRLQHGPPGDPEEIGGHRGEIHPRVLQDLVEALGLPDPLLDLGLAVAGEVAELPDGLGRDERGADQPVLHELGDPAGVLQRRSSCRGRCGGAGRRGAGTRTRPPARSGRASSTPRSTPSPPRSPRGRRARPAGRAARRSWSRTRGPPGPVPPFPPPDRVARRKSHLTESVVRARGNSSGFPRLPRPTQNRARSASPPRRRRATWPFSSVRGGP